MSEHTPGDLATVHARLFEVQAALVALLADTSGQTATVELDQAAVGRLSRIDAIQQQEMAKAQHRLAAQRLGRVERALADFDDPEVDFGDCRSCGEPIPLGRLNARPEALFCVACAAERGR
jgi:DnaK suppressor protein